MVSDTDPPNHTGNQSKSSVRKGYPGSQVEFFFTHLVSYSSLYLGFIGSFVLVVTVVMGRDGVTVVRSYRRMGLKPVVYNTDYLSV